MFYDPYALVIHIDGSAFDNPGGEGGIAGIVEYPDTMNRETETIFQIGYEETTNQRMELLAFIEALEWVRTNNELLGGSRVVVLSDSRYVCDNLSRARYWKKDKWRNRNGRPVENSDLWDRTLSLMPKLGRRLDLQYEVGKSNPIGKDVDKKAKQAASGLQKNRDTGFRGGEISRTKLPGDVATMFHACGQEALIRIYRKTALFQFKRKDCKIIFELISEETGTSISKHFAYATPEIEDGLHRNHTYRVLFNENPGNPRIERMIEELKVGADEKTN
ncbi:MAG: RNase H family protein [Bacteroidota bacterium]